MSNPKLEIVYLPPGSLIPNRWNSNSVSSEMEARLESSIREFGFIKPIITRRLFDGTLQILGGEHRARKASELGMETIPVVVLDGVDEKRAKAMGLADNGRYGQDDALKLAAILGDIGTDLIDALPFDESDLAGIFSASSVNLDDLGFGEDPDPGAGLEELAAARPSITHELMRFKVPIEDRDNVQQFIDQIIKRRGLSAEKDSMVAAGMALVEIVNAAKETL
jgi:ParB-like chromosome segregation protein Spo0J